MSKSYSIKTTQGLNVKDYNLFDSCEHVNNLSPTYMGILKIFKEVFKQVDMSKIINKNKKAGACQAVRRSNSMNRKLTVKPSYRLFKNHRTHRGGKVQRQRHE